MSAQDLKQLLEDVEDTREIVLSPGMLSAPTTDATTGELAAVWAVARAEANLALDAWRAAPGPAAYAVYRASEDRADAAQDALAAPSGG